MDTRHIEDEHTEPATAVEPVAVCAPAHIATPEGTVRVHGSAEVARGRFFVYHEAGVTVGRWGYKERAKPWTLAYKPNKGVGFSSCGAFKTAEAAVKAATKKNAEA